jgi:hypothetical protein
MQVEKRNDERSAVKQALSLKDIFQMPAWH